MRLIDDQAIRSHGAIRFRSEYDYAVFEYWRSAKVIHYLERFGPVTFGRVLDDGCGGGGMCVSLGEEAERVVGIDPSNRFGSAGTRLAAEKGVSNVRFAVADGLALPFGAGAFDTVLSHAVIEHVPDPLVYLQEIRRVLRRGGLLYLQTQPYLSPEGSHLPKLKWPIPLHLLVGRTLAFRLLRWLSVHAPGTFKASQDGSYFLTRAARGEVHQDDLLNHVTIRKLRQHVTLTGFRVLHEQLHPGGVARRLLPGPVLRSLPALPFARDVLTTNIEFLLRAE